MGEWGARIAICSGSMFEPYAAYSATGVSSGLQVTMVLRGQRDKPSAGPPICVTRRSRWRDGARTGAGCDRMGVRENEGAQSGSQPPSSASQESTQ
ncbi:hypothetical protein GCM10010528_26330 [Gordonia defluvii]|uniref:Uncharacterized protein n=1 Tax=Gordonia defluvii TaxID=283718 RepID=A0ABP6LI42_9ACTN